MHCACWLLFLQLCLVHCMLMFKNLLLYSPLIILSISELMVFLTLVFIVTILCMAAVPAPSFLVPEGTQRSSTLFPLERDTLPQDMPNGFPGFSITLVFVSTMDGKAWMTFCTFLAKQPSTDASIIQIDV